MRIFKAKEGENFVAAAISAGLCLDNGEWKTFPGKKGRVVDYLHNRILKISFNDFPEVVVRAKESKFLEEVEEA